MIKRIPATLLFAALVVFTTQSAGQSAKAPELTIRPIEDVFTDGPPRIADLSEQDGTLLFVSSVPLACSVVKTTRAANRSVAGTRLIMAAPLTGFCI